MYPKYINDQVPNKGKIKLKIKIGKLNEKKCPHSNLLIDEPTIFAIFYCLHITC